jgi:hypothetical protein
MTLLILIALATVCAIVYVKTKKKDTVENEIKQPVESEDWDHFQKAIEDFKTEKEASTPEKPKSVKKKEVKKTTAKPKKESKK